MFCCERSLCISTGLTNISSFAVRINNQNPIQGYGNFRIVRENIKGVNGVFVFFFIRPIAALARVSDFLSLRLFHSF